MLLMHNKEIILIFFVLFRCVLKILEPFGRLIMFPLFFRAGGIKITPVLFSNLKNVYKSVILDTVFERMDWISPKCASFYDVIDWLSAV